MDSAHALDQAAARDGKPDVLSANANATQLEASSAPTRNERTRSTACKTSEPDRGQILKPDLHAIAIELQRIVAYPIFRGWAGSTVVCLGEASPVSLTYLAAGQLLIASPDPALRCVGLWAVGRCVEKDETISIETQHQSGVRETLSKRQLYLEALHCNPQFSAAYNNLSTTLCVGEQVLLRDNRLLDRHHLYLEALRFDPKCAQVYYNLGNNISAAESAVLPDGRTLDQRQLYLEALYLDPKYANALCNLAVALLSNETATLPDGRTFTKQGMLMEALRCDPTNSVALFNLGHCLASGEKIALCDGRVLSKHQLYLEALLGNPYLHTLRAYVVDTTPDHEAWSRRCHSLLFGNQTNVLFATLLLGIQRLEETGVLPLAHQAMLEDMLECWTWSDTTSLC